MSFAVARMTKLKADNLVGIGNHDQRKTTNHSNEDIDVSRSHLNYDLVAGRTNNFKTDIEAYINENKVSSRAVRKDAVLVNEWIITSDKVFFEQLDENDTRKYFETAKQYFANDYGDENIRYAVVHMDEKTPHMHMGIVPFDDDKKLSAKRIFNREALQRIQDELSQYLKENGFDVERGNKNKERKNLSVPEYKAMREELKKIETEKQETQARLADTQKEFDEIKPRSNKNIDSKPTLLNKNKVLVDKNDLADLERRASFSDSYNLRYTRATSEVNSLVDKLDRKTWDYNDLERENERLRNLVSTLQNLVKKVDVFLQRKIGIHLPDTFLERAGLKEPSKKAPERSQEIKRHKSDELGGPHL
ncbi:MobV family relaxase [Periweissella fabalis]|uniref:Plasmid recombination protein n=1 Tax=Periweissella fabalis TaxID=1070421 RepID=A0A7X6S3G0_9LACO|nr:MobV family relaxase [Periweissella fabalis]MCM0598446.1 plasmid recombination protein [Periweissella fabalis]NKZ25069.1 plasmid recombination protein [Periweissella fabalis]